MPLPPVTRFAVPVATLFMLGVVAPACSGDEPPSGEDPATTVEAAATYQATTPSEPESTFPRSPVSPVPLPSLPPPQGEPTGYDDTSRFSAASLAECADAGSCEGVNAPLVVWPGAELSAIPFARATLTGADLRGADASFGEFPVANLSGADLTGANFSGANLSGADLTGATIIRVDFSGADLSGADLSDAIADGAEFRGAILCATTMPDGGVRNDDC